MFSILIIIKFHTKYHDWREIIIDTNIIRMINFEARKIDPSSTPVFTLPVYGVLAVPVLPQACFVLPRVNWREGRRFLFARQNGSRP